MKALMVLAFLRVGPTQFSLEPIMHPAKSVIFFTTASGAGYGIMFWLAILAASGSAPANVGFGLAAFIIGFALITSGLLSSTLHLGRPERAWRALSQWRSSWLSREGVAALATFAPLSVFALSWMLLGVDAGITILAGVIGGAMSILTIFTTSMIYASLKAIPNWSNSLTVAGYLILGPMNGVVIVAALAGLFGETRLLHVLPTLAIVSLIAGGLVKLLYWQNIRTRPLASDAGTATGLSHLGRVEMSASPHDVDNYVLREMGFRIARKHSDKLRLIAFATAFVGPATLIISVFLLGSQMLSALALVAAWALCQLGVTVERWLFFAEAKHVVLLYYGEQSV